jgi:cytoskeletal protein CcmA (bactofilin family)
LGTTAQSLSIESSEIDGTYAFTGTVMLNGKFKGEF